MGLKTFKIKRAELDRISSKHFFIESSFSCLTVGNQTFLALDYYIYVLAPQIFRPSLRPCRDSAGDEPVNMSCVKRIIY